MADNNDFFSTNVEIFGKIVIYKSLKFYWIGPKSAAAIITPFINLTLFWSLQIRQKGKIVFDRLESYLTQDNVFDLTIDGPKFGFVKNLFLN